jgi:hypothetical protein
MLLPFSLPNSQQANLFQGHRLNHLHNLKVVLQFSHPEIHPNSLLFDQHLSHQNSPISDLHRNPLFNLL